MRYVRAWIGLGAMSLEIPCPGVCGGIPGWIDPSMHLGCTVCHGSGLWHPPPSAAEEYAAVVAGRGARLTKRQRAGVRLRKRRNLKAYRAQQRQEARDLERARREFFATRAPSPESLDQLKRENACASENGLQRHSPVQT